MQIQIQTSGTRHRQPGERGSRTADALAQKSLSGKLTKKMKKGDGEGGGGEIVKEAHSCASEMQRNRE